VTRIRLREVCLAGADLTFIRERPERSSRAGMLEAIRFFVVAHRGASAYEPENTLRSVRRALEIGADAVEVDVRLSADGFPVVIHDETVDRTTNDTGKVAEMTLEELRKLDAGQGERIPTLEEILDAVRGRAVLFLELKVDEAAFPSLRLVRERGMLDGVLFTSFSQSALSRVKAEEEGAHIGLIYFRPSDGIVGAKKLGCEFVLPYHRLATERAIAFAHRMRLRVVPWTVDDLETARELKRRGADGVASNRPDVMMPLRE